MAPTPIIDANTPEPDARLSTRPSLLAGRRKWAILALGLLVLTIGFIAWQRQTNAPSPATTATTNVGRITTTKKNTTPTFQQVTVPLVADADKDGLTDDREAQLKTNPKLADTDGDGLSDYDEVVIYGTNPLIQDTDGDGFSDGAEVQSGNNPKGPGKLNNIQQSISNINAQ